MPSLCQPHPSSSNTYREDRYSLRQSRLSGFIVGQRRHKPGSGEKKEGGAGYGNSQETLGFHQRPQGLRPQDEHVS